MLTCIDVQSTESTLLREIANQNPDDEFLTSLVDCALEKLLAPAAKDNLAGGEATDLAYRSKREAVDCLTGAKEKNCCLPDDTSDDCNWSIIAELPTELGSVNSFSMCEDSDESEDYLAEAEKAMHLLRAKGSSVSKESELTEWNEGCYWYERGEAADRDWFFF
ncbi:uncharacterized protein N7529_010722 [Penicillium soppii]|uniref:uncharacterized protein n=1 Tax=Penicillium soppii TaxID=69789 RepID=UPI0025493635|nr:uncharacterized protein N7529_010722 [Penicillium soppii]KAJ5851337.1 hypothetical protein N7529_010722 [Penicillium soppii]